jgi:hypothetical protein
VNPPTVHWREPGDVSAVLDVPAAGVFIGMDSGRSTPVLLPAVGPRVTRIGVVGDWRIAALLAYRLLGAGCLLTLATAEPGRWRHLLDAAGPRGTVARSGAGWPPPQVGGAAHLLVTDLATPPNPAVGTRTPCTVVHVVEQVPPGGPFWPAVDAVLVSGRGHGAALARLLGRDDARALDAIGPTQLGLLDRHRAVAVTAVLADPERSLLLGR